MAEIIGKEVEFGVATEATRGTKESAADKWMRKVTANVLERATHAQDETTRGKIESGEGRRAVQKYVEGDVSGIVHADVLGWLLSNIYGKVATTNVSGSVYSHVFTIKQNVTHQSLTLFAKDGAVQQLAMANCMIDSLELNVTQEDFVRFSASFVGGAATDDGDTPSYDTEYDFIARDVVVKIADSEAGLSGADALEIKELDISWAQNLIRDHVVGSYTPRDVHNSGMMIEGSFNKNFIDETFKDLYTGDGEKYMSITITGEADIGGGENPEIEIILNKVQVNDWERDGDAEELVTETVGFRAYFNEDDGEQSQTTLKNLISSYDNVPSN